MRARNREPGVASSTTVVSPADRSPSTSTPAAGYGDPGSPAKGLAGAPGSRKVPVCELPKAEGMAMVPDASAA